MIEVNGYYDLCHLLISCVLSYGGLSVDLWYIFVRKLNSKLATGYLLNLPKSRSNLGIMQVLDNLFDYNAPFSSL